MNKADKRNPVIVMYEDRPTALLGVQLAILSLGRWSPDVEVRVTIPGAPPELVSWVDRQPNATLWPLDLALSGWDVKPALLLAHLRDTDRPVAWMDTDLIVSGDLAARMAEAPSSDLVVAEDVWYARRAGTFARTEAWGLKPGRLYPYVANTAVVRVDASHIPLLEEWNDLLHDEVYRSAQARPYHERPFHLIGDQEVLTALLGSEQWQHLGVSHLKRGTDIVHCLDAQSVSPAERLRLTASRTIPLLIHGAGPKPWLSPVQTEADWRHPLRRLDQRVNLLRDRRSLYAWAARQYRDELPGSLDWAGCDSAAVDGRDEAADVVAMGDRSTWTSSRRAHPALSELAVSVVTSIPTGAKRAAGRMRLKMAAASF